MIKHDLASMSRPHGFMVDVRMSFGWVICMVGGSGAPEVAELALGFVAA